MVLTETVQNPRNDPKWIKIPSEVEHGGYHYDLHTNPRFFVCSDRSGMNDIQNY